MKRPVDRSDLVGGVNQTERDHRAPLNEPRKLENVTLRDGRIKRRKGIQPFSQGRFIGDMLMKHTPAELNHVRIPREGDPGIIASTPWSYGLLKWHDDFQPTSQRDWTIEFFLKIGDISEFFVQNPQARYTKNEYGPGTDQYFLRYPNVGVYVYDQAVTSNWHNVPDDETSPEAGVKWDGFSLTALAVSFTSNEVFVTFDLWHSADEIYNQRVIRGTHNGQYTHVSIVYDSATRILRLYTAEGVTNFLYVLEEDEKWAGEVDYVNGREGALERDIVLLNEYTVRGAMASACKVHPTAQSNADEALFDYGELGGNTLAPNVLNLSPPRGTGLAELRFWHEARSVENISKYRLTRLPAGTVFENLKGYWRLDDGGPVCTETVPIGQDRTPRIITLHHGGPGYVADSAMPSGIGMSFADGQCLRKRYSADDAINFVEDSYAALNLVFHRGDRYGEQYYASTHDFTVQMRIRCPHTFGQEINLRDGDDDLKDVWYGTTGKEEAGRGTQTFQPFALLSGEDDTDDPSTKWFVRTPFVADDVSNLKTYHRAFDQTLWSIESQPISASSSYFNNDRDHRRIPLTRGMLTPEGRVAFEFFGWDFVNDFGREWRLVSEEALSPQQAVTITFRKRTLSRSVGSAPNQEKSAYGFALEIFFDGELVGQIKIGGRNAGDDVDLSASASPQTSPLTSGPMVAGGIRDVNIGCSYVDDVTERGMRHNNLIPGNVASSFKPIPYQTKRYLSPWQDQPGNFTMGFWRMWASAIPDSEIKRVGHKFFNRGDQPKSLLFNIQIERPSGNQVPSFGPFPVVFETTYKSWGDIRTSSRNTGDPTDPDPARIITGFHQEDRLGYGGLPAVFDNDRFARCNGIHPFTATLARKIGVTAVFDGALSFDDNVSGQYSQLYLQNLGLLNDYSAGQRWQSTSIADRSVLTSRGGQPKTFDGRGVATLGFRPYTGGQPRVESPTDDDYPSTDFTAGEWVGFRVAYVAESASIVSFSDQGAIQLQDTDPGGEPFLRFTDIAPHPDPRVTSIAICLTSAPAASWEEAISLPVFFTQQALANTYVETIDIIQKPVAAALQLDVTRTPFPSVSLAASAYGSLYLSGDELVPDVIYYSDTGNPESINSFVNRIIIEDASGDEIVGLQTIFGTLWAFKQNSIWRVVQTGSSVTDQGLPIINHDLAKIATIGPVSPRAMVLVTIPESGRTALAMWTRNGPYLFDGINLDYLGWKIEGEKEPYDWLDPNSVVAVHDQRTREISFLYEGKCNCSSDICPAGRPGRAAVFNYRTGAWSFATGIIGTEAISADFSKELTLRGPDFAPGTSTGGVGPGVVAPQFAGTYMSLVGGATGKVYTWGSGFRSGIVDLPTYVLDVVVIDSINNGRIINYAYDTLPPGINNPDPIPNHELRGVWATLVSENGERYFSFPILDNGGRQVTVELSKCSSVPFAPSAGDRLYIGVTPALVSWPWDQLGSPGNNKQLIRWSIWGDGQMSWRHADNWDEDTFGLWKRLGFVDKKRRHIETLRGHSDAFKFELFSLASEFAIDSYMLEASDQEGGNN